MNWGKVLPIPNFDATQWPEVETLMEQGIHLKQHHFRLDGSEMATVINGSLSMAMKGGEATAEARSKRIRMGKP